MVEFMPLYYLDFNIHYLEQYSFDQFTIYLAR